MKRLGFLVALACLVFPAIASAAAVGPTPKVGDTLTAPQAVFSGTLTPMNATSYQWKDCNKTGGACVNIVGATHSTYVVQSSDVGFALRVSVSATSAYTPVATTAATPVPPTNTQAPAITGTPQQGDKLTVSNGTWSGDTPMTFTYAWSDGQTGQSITLGSSDVGQSITATVTATNDAGNASATSTSVGPVTAASPPPSGLQSYAYWLGWEPTAISETSLPFADLTRVSMFSAEVTSTSALNLSQNLLTSYNMPNWTSVLHQHGVQAVITIGDNTSSSAGSFGDACSSANQSAFITNLVNYAVNNGFDGIDWDDEDGSSTNTAIAQCVEALATVAHATDSQAGKPLFVSEEEDQSIASSNPYGAVEQDYGSLDSVVNEFYGFNPSNDWNCGNGSPAGTCAYVHQIDQPELNAGVPKSKILEGMATCCGSAQSAYSNLSTTSATVDTSGTVTSIPLASALSAALPAENVVVSTGGNTPANYEVFSTSGASSGATSIPITGSVRGNGSFQFPAGSEVQSDYAGPWDCYNMAAYANANGYQGTMDFDLQDSLSFPCLAQAALGLGLTH